MFLYFGQIRALKMDLSLKLKIYSEKFVLPMKCSVIDDDDDNIMLNVIVSQSNNC